MPTLFELALISKIIKMAQFYLFKEQAFIMQLNGYPSTTDLGYIIREFRILVLGQTRTATGVVRYGVLLSTHRGTQRNFLSISVLFLFSPGWQIKRSTKKSFFFLLSLSWLQHFENNFSIPRLHISWQWWKCYLKVFLSCFFFVFILGSDDIKECHVKLIKNYLFPLKILFSLFLLNLAPGWEEILCSKPLLAIDFERKYCSMRISCS